MVVGDIPLGQSTGYATRGFAAYQMAGAILRLRVLVLWRAREGLKEMIRAAFSKNQHNEEPLSPRTALGGLFGGMITLVVARTVAGVPFWVAFATTTLFLLTMVAMTRMVSEGGLLFIQTPFRPSDLLIPFFGFAPMTSRGLAVLNLEETIFSFDVRASPMPSVMDAFRLLESSRLNRRALLPSVLGACGIAMVVACATTLLIGRANGAASVSS